MNIEFPDFTPSQFDDLLYPIYSVPENKSILTVLKNEIIDKEFKEDLSIYGFDGTKDKNKVIRYIAFNYDRASPFQKEYKDTAKRKYAAALLAGFEVDKEGLFENKVEMMLVCRIPEINKMIIRYLRNHHDHDWAYLKVIEDTYYISLLKMYDESEDKKPTFKELKDMKEDIYKTQLEILAGEKNKRLDDEFYEQISLDRLELRPEDIARKLRLQKDGISEHSKEKVS